MRYCISPQFKKDSGTLRHLEMAGAVVGAEAARISSEA